jgi:hypothetical protein
MGLCSDASVTYLRDLGYNVVRHPRANVNPLDLIGKQNGEFASLGGLNRLLSEALGPLPEVTRNEPAANVNGRRSSKLSLGIGADILGSVLGAMGGKLGVDVSYTDAQTMQFEYADVLSDSVVALDVGAYLRGRDVDAGNPVLREYVLGHGDLFLVTRTVKARKFSVSYERKNGVGAKVDAAALGDLTGAKVEVAPDAARSWVVTYSGSDFLVFGFQCFRVGVVDGALSVEIVSAGDARLAAPHAPPAPMLLTDQGLLDVRP